MLSLRRKKKLGRYTVGLTNVANDCFANSNLQALASLPGLYTYLQEFSYLTPLPNGNGGNADGSGPVNITASSTQPSSPVSTSQSVSRSSSQSKPNPRGRRILNEDMALGALSCALADFILELNEPVLSAKSLNPWKFLVVLERIYKSRISRNQHDAHELLHLILETLEIENEKLKKAISSNANDSLDEKTANLSLSISSSSQPAAYVPDFPFTGSTVDQITCSKCGYSPSTRSSAFLVLSLVVPQKRSASLVELLEKLSSPEYIQDYGCTMCKLLYKIAQLSGQLSNPSNFKSSELRQATQSSLDQFQSFLENPSSMPESLEAALPKDVTSNIAKSTEFSKLPQLLTIHLSRSIYGGYGASRNSCKISVTETLELFELSNDPKPNPKFDVNSTPKTASALNSMGSLNKSRVKYQLAAMIRHKGTHYAGHYECFRRKNLAWWSNVIEGSKLGISNPSLFSSSNPLSHTSANTSQTLSQAASQIPSEVASTASINTTPIAATSIGTSGAPSLKTSSSISISSLQEPTLGMAGGIEPPTVSNGESEEPSPVLNSSSAESSVSTAPAVSASSSSSRNSLSYVNPPPRSSPSPARISTPQVFIQPPSGASSSNGGLHDLNNPSSLSLNGIYKHATNDGPKLQADVAPASQHPWWKISDDKVWECSTKDVLKEESGAYLLFYERIG